MRRVDRQNCRKPLETKFPAGKRGYRWIALLGLLALVFAGPVAADAIQLKSGRLLVGEVKDYDGKTVTIELSTGGVTRLPVDQLSPTWRYRLHAAHYPPTTADAHMKLAGFCAKHKLWTQAREHYKLAGEMDKKLGGKIELRLLELDERIAGKLFERLTTALKAKRFDKAKDALDALSKRYRDTAPAQWAADLRPAILEGLAAARHVAPDEQLERELKREVKLQKRIKKTTAEVDKKIDEAEEMFRKALGFEGRESGSKAMRAYELAHELFKSAVLMLEQLERKSTDRDATRALYARRQKVVHRWVLVCESAAHLRARQGNFKDAHKWITIALRLEPLNERVKKFAKIIDEHRITRKLSKMTNIKPVVRGH